VKAEKIISELKKFLSAPRLKIDYVTIGGSGEPTLNACLEKLVSGIKSLTDIPIALLSNGSLFFDKKVRDAVKEVDIILPSLDAGNEETFRALNRPHPALNLGRIITGLRELRQEFTGPLWLEVLLVEGLNDQPAHVRQLQRIIEQLEPDRVQLNTAVRPGTEPWVSPLSSGKLEEIKALMGHKAEVVVSFPYIELQELSVQTESRIYNLLRRRPCPADEIARATGLCGEELIPILERLAREEKIQCQQHDGKKFYRAP
jgi:wyosine [tRNA(Phe)-imidazoG37] synthetase (radical SAM superfamily)